MPIVSSDHAIDVVPDATGRRLVVEHHIDDASEVHSYVYWAPGGADHLAIRNARVNRLNDLLAEGEAVSVTQRDDALLTQQTAAQFAARFWQRVRDAFMGGDRVAYHQLIWWVWARVQAGHLTNDQVRQSFNAAYGRNLNAAQWNNFVTTRLVPIKDRYLTWLAEASL